MENKEKETVEVSEETKETKTEKPKLFKKPKAKLYSKTREETDDAETEAFARGELAKFNREKAETATVQKDTEASEEIASLDGKATPSTERPENAEERVFKKRYDDLKRHYDSTLGKHKDEVRTLRTQLEQSSKQFIPPKSKDELESWRKEYPDVYEMVETIAMSKADSRAKEMETKYQNLQVQQEEIAKEKAEVELLKMHPDFNDLRSKDDFHEWAAKQDPVIQDWLYENTSNASLAARALDLYKMDKGLGKYSKKEAQDVKKEAAKAIWTNAILSVPVSVLFFGVGTALFVYYQQQPTNLDPISKIDQIFPHFILQQMPAGLAGLVIAGVFAAAMSSLDSSMHSISTAFTTDFLSNGKDSETILRTAKRLTLILGILGTISALYIASQDSKNLWDTLMGYVGLILGTLGGLFTLAIFTNRTSSIHAWIGVIAAVLALYIFKFHTDYHLLMIGAVGTASCFFTGWLASLIIPRKTKDLAGLTWAQRKDR